MLGRIIIALALSFAVFVAPAAPIELTKIVSAKSICFAHINMDPCQRCPMHQGPASSSTGSTCCSAQAPCFVCYSHTSDNFVVGMNRVGFASFTNDRVSARFQRPSVPPPRVGFS